MRNPVHDPVEQGEASEEPTSQLIARHQWCGIEVSSSWVFYLK
jgi:hypothetical protein